MRRGTTPAWMTASIFSFEPSERYDRAQHASVRTSSSSDCTRRLRTGKAGFVYRDNISEASYNILWRVQIRSIKVCTIFKETCSNEGWGFPLQKFDNVHVAFLTIESLVWSLN